MQYLGYAHGSQVVDQRAEEAQQLVDHEGEDDDTGDEPYWVNRVELRLGGRHDG